MCVLLARYLKSNYSIYFFSWWVFVWIFNKDRVKQCFWKILVCTFSALLLLLFLSVYSQIHSLKHWSTAAPKSKILWLFVIPYSPTDMQLLPVAIPTTAVLMGSEHAKHSHICFHWATTAGTAHVAKPSATGFPSASATTAWWEFWQHCCTC